MTSRLRRLALPLLLAASLAACGGDEPAPPDAGAPAVATAEAPAAVPDAAPAGLDALDEAALREAARLALAEQRVYAPAGDNAIEYYLALRERHPAEAGLQEALVDFAPYALIAAERAIAAGDLAEGERLAAELARIDAGAPALPRLRAAIDDARTRREAELADADRRAEAEATAATAAEAQAQAARQAALEAVAATPAPAPAEPAPPASTVAAGPAQTPAVAPPAADPPQASAPPPQASAPVVAAPAPEEPRALSTPAPRYPPLAQRRRIEGEVRLMFTVGVDGSVSSVEVESATPPDVFDREAIAAVSRWRFAPMQAPVRVRRTLRFRLPDAG